MSTSRRFERVSRRDEVTMIPQPAGGDPGLLIVDATWGTIQPMTLAPGVRTIGELELIEHLRAGGPLIDTRLAKHHRKVTIAGAIHISHEDLPDRAGEIDRSRPSAYFCNGPQCAATPDAVSSLLAAGWPAELILYYRGGIHDWMTLGLPVEPGRPAS